MKIKTRTQVEKRWLAMKNELNSWLTAWRDIQRFILPTRGFFFETVPNRGYQVDHKTQLNNSPQRAVGTLAAGMISGLASPTRPWFKIGLEDPDLMEHEDVKEWLDAAERSLYTIFSKSNTYGTLNQVFEELGGFGTGCFIENEDFDTVVRHRMFTAGEYFLGCDAQGRVNSFGRQYWMTIGQLVEEFGEENVTPNVLAQFKQGIVDQWIRVCHLIEPNDDRIPELSDYEKKPIRSIQWIFGSPTTECLRIKGYDEFPVIAPRWDTTTTAHVYGFGPGHYALGDTRMLMKLERDYLVALDKVIDPPVMMDGSIQGEANTLPGGVNRTSQMIPNVGMRAAYQINPNLEAAQAKIDRTAQSIDQTFYKDMFLMLSSQEDPQKTAYEISKRYEEKMWVLGPVIDRSQNELLSPLIKRTFMIALRTGVIPPPPPSVQQQELKIEYISALAQAQRMYMNTAIQQLLSFVGSVAGVDPNAIDNVDVDEAIRKYADLEGVPPKILRSAAVVQGIRDAKQKAQQAAQMQQNAQAAVDGAKTLSETKVGQNSALDQLLGNQNSPTAGAAS